MAKRSKQFVGGRIRHFVASEPMPLLRAMTSHLKLSVEYSRELLQLGAVYCNKRRLHAESELRKGDYLRVHIEPKRYPLPAIDWRNCVVAEGDEYLIVNKPPGVPMHAMLDNEVENLLYQMRGAGYRELWVTQRLDNDTEGLCVLAKTKKFQREFNEILRHRKLEKRYRAWVTGLPPTGPLIHYMRPTPWAPKEISPEAVTGWARCELVVEKCVPIAGTGDRALSEIDVKLITGRTHQIRVQLSALGTPLVGDPLYGGIAAPFLALQACELSFHAKAPVRVEIPRPEAWRSDRLS